MYRVLFLSMALLLHVGNEYQMYFEIGMIVFMVLAVVPPFFIEIQASVHQLLDAFRIIKKTCFPSGEQELIIRPSCQRRWKKRMRLCRRKCSCWKWCCVEDYMVEQSGETGEKNEKNEKQDSGGSEEDSEADSDMDSEEEEEREERRKQKKKIVVVDPLDIVDSVEHPTDEIVRLRKELAKQGFTIKATPMLGKQ